MQLPPKLISFCRRPVVQGAALFLLTVIVYLPATRGVFIWDDDITLNKNPLVKLPLSEGLRNIWFSTFATDYYPLTWSTFWIEWRLFKLNPAGYHVVNILLHAISSVFLWRIILRLRLPGGLWTAWCAALLFAIHPVCVDSVSWISQRKNTLSMVFFLATILSFLKFADSRKKFFYWLAALAFLAALLSKSSIITLPVILIVLLWYQRGSPYLQNLKAGLFPFAVALVCLGGAAWLFRTSPGPAFFLVLIAFAPLIAMRKTALKNELVHLLPFFILAGAAAFMTLWFQGKVLGYGIDTGFKSTSTITGTLNASLSGKIPIAERLLVTGQVYWFYMWKILVPIRVSMVYNAWTVNPLQLTHYLPTFFLITSILGAFLLRNKIGRGLCAGLTLAAVALLPVLGLVVMAWQPYSWVANHLCYVAVPIVSTLAVSLGAFLVTKFRASPAPLIAGSLFLAVSALFAAQSWERNTFYINPELLWRDCIAKYPHAFPAYNELGVFLIENERYGEAIDVLHQCIAIRPGFDKPYINIGNAYAHLEQTAEAITAYKHALRINPNNDITMGNLGLMYIRSEQPEKALDITARAIKRNPMNSGAYYHSGLAYQQLNRHKEALKQFSRAIELDPTTAKFHGTLGSFLFEQNQHALAFKHLLFAAQLGRISVEELNTLSWIMATHPDPKLRDGATALEICLKIERSHPEKDPAFLMTKAAAFAELGRFEEAITTLKEAAALAEEKNETDLLPRILDATKLYQSGKPTRSS